MEYVMYHSGIKGMKWGIRRYQNKDGSLTPLGRKRYTNSDGTLNEKGKQYVAKERARLKAEQIKADNLKKTNSKLDKLDEMRNKLNSINKKPVDDTPDMPKKKPTSDMTDKELQDKVNRLRNEDAYRDLNKKLGYDMPQTELDYKIAEMKKQKEYLELQRDINNLTPKHVSKGKQIMDTVLNKVIAPAATEAGKKFLTNYLSEAGQKAIKNKFTDKAKEAQKTAEKVAENQAKVETKAREKAAKKQAKADAKAEAEGRKLVEKAYEEYLRGGDNKNDSTYSQKGGGRDYVNPNQERGLTVYNPNMSSSTALAVSKAVNDHSSSSVTSLVTKSNVSTGKTKIAGLIEGPVRYDDGKYMHYDEDDNFIGYWSDIRGDSDGII